MQLKGTHLFSAPRAAVWEALLDPTVLAQALPGGETLEKVADNEYKAAMNVRVGPVQGKFAGKVELSDIQPVESYRMKVNGSGPAGFVNGEGSLLLSEQEQGTLLSYEGEVQVGGKIAGVGQRLIDSTAKSIIKQGFKVLDEQIQYRLAPPPAAVPPAVAEVVPIAAPPSVVESASASATSAETVTPSVDAPPVIPAARPAPPAPSATKIALEVAKDVTRDLAAPYIPPNQQEKVFYAVLGALGMLLFVVLVRLVQSRE
jgi:hypothetical protein